MLSKDVKPFHTFLKKQVLGLGFSDEVSERVAWDMATVIIDRPKEAEMAPYAFLYPGSTYIAMRSGSMNSERIRHMTGIAIVLDMSALRRRYEAGER